MTIQLCVKMCLKMALYSAVNGPERSSRFYVFYNESIHIMAAVGYGLFSSWTQNVKFKVQLLDW